MEMLRCAKELKLRARGIDVKWEQLAKLPLPAIAELQDGTFIILGRATADDVLVQVPSVGRPERYSREQLLEKWTGRDGASRIVSRFSQALRHHVVSASHP
jgi:subfamily B ATP-binding cassette protein HlyB/CyaB